MSQFAFLKLEFAGAYELKRKVELAAEAEATTDLFASLQRRVFRGEL